MKYTFEGVKQSGLIEYRLDPTDSWILAYLVSLMRSTSDKIIKIWIDKTPYTWIDVDAAIEEMPILKLKHQAFNDRLTKYVKKGILLREERHHFNIPGKYYHKIFYYHFHKEAYFKLFNSMNAS
jgi:hypothetical protein